jgi:hypothetical protein
MSHSNDENWPDLPYPAWADSCATLQLMTQVVGKIRLAKSPWVNHSWHVTLYVTPRGLTTSPIIDGQRQFQVDFDFIDHQLLIEVSDGQRASLPLAPMSVAEFYTRVMGLLQQLGIDVTIDRMPNEVAEPIRFDHDTTHASYDPDYVNRFWRVLLQTDRVFKQFRARFTGKSSPVHFFWGSFDLAVTRFSGREAPPHPGGIPNLPDSITREAYCREVSSAGFWPGGGPIDYPAYYSYAYPTPDGFGEQGVRPGAAFYDAQLGEFLLPYSAVREADDPDAMLLEFLQTSYEAAAVLADWNRVHFEREPIAPVD